MGAALDNPLPWERLYRESPPMGAVLKNPLPWERLYIEFPSMGAALKNPLSWERLYRIPSHGSGSLLVQLDD